jgi:hypothetical protein
MIPFHKLFNILFGTGMVQLLTFYKGGGGGGSSTTTQNQLDPTVRPFVEYGLQEAKQLYQTDTPQYYPYQTYVDPSAQTQSALQAAQTRALAGSPLVPAAQQQLQDTIQGKYLGNNPFLSAAMEQGASEATQRYNDAIQATRSGAAQAGRYGSSAMFDQQSRNSQNLANALAQQAGQLLYQNYGAERAAQQAATQLAPSMAQADYADINQLLNVGQMSEDYQRQALESDIARYDFEQNKPYSKLAAYLGAAYGAPMGQVSTTESSGGGK